MRSAFKPYPFFEADETPPTENPPEGGGGGISLDKKQQILFNQRINPVLLKLLTGKMHESEVESLFDPDNEDGLVDALQITDQKTLNKLAAAVIAKARFLKDAGEKKAQEAGAKPEEIKWGESVDKALTEKPDWYNDVVERAQKKEEEKTGEEGDAKETPLLRDLSPQDKEIIKKLGNTYVIGIVNGTITSDKAKEKLESNPDLKKIESKEVQARMVEVILHKAIMIFNTNSAQAKKGRTPPALKNLSGEWWVTAETDLLNHKNEKKDQLKYFLKNSTPIQIEMEKLAPEKQEELTNYLNTSFPEKNARMLLKTDPIAALGITVYEIETEEGETYNITLYPAKGKGWFTRLPAKLNPKVWLMTNKWATMLVTNLQNWMQKGVLGRNAGESQLRMAIAYSIEKTPQAGLQKIAQIAGVQVPTPQQIASKVKRNVIKGSAKGGIGGD